MDSARLWKITLYVFAMRNNKNLHEGMLVGRNVNQKPYGGLGKENSAANMMRWNR
jgi:hypothetical protein